jgi:electron transfer flavoprotein alpha subunit
VNGTLIVAEHVNGELRDVTRELVTAAQKLGGPVAVAVITKDPSRFDVSFEGVDEVVNVPVEQAEFENDVYQTAVEALVAERQPQAVLLGFTVNAIGYAPAIAAKHGFGFASDVHGLRREGETVVATRSFYGGKVDAELEFPANRPLLLLIRPTVFSPAKEGGSAATTRFLVETPISRARHLGFEEAAVGDVDITTADFLLSIGRGIGEQDAIPQFERLAEKLGALLSVSRPLVDAGWMPNARQVGQSGKTVKPKVYLALGISGAVQHLAGMSASGTIIAVNTDPEAAIFKVAHFGAVADLFDVAEELEKLS